MGIADFFRPKHRHSDVRVRTEAVKAMTTDDAASLIQIARTDRDVGVRRIAIEKIDKADVLAEIAESESEGSLRDLAGERAAQLWRSIACSGDADAAGNALGGIIKVGDQRALVEVIVRAALPAIRKRAFGELRDPKALAEIAKSDAAQDLRTAAIARIDDGDVLRALAIDTTQKEVGLAAVEKIDDVDRLESVAQKAKNKAVRQKARKIVSEIEDAERAKKPGVPDEVKRRRAERAQLVREVESVADTFEFAKVTETVKRAEAQWAQLGGDEEGDDRFAKAVERFWKRKQVYDEQARSADELRAVEREAQAQRAQREEPAAEPEPVTAEPPPAAEDTEEAKARRAEEEARRQAQAAERTAKAKEDAERGVAIAASLKALCDDMEQLASSNTKDQRSLDRLLGQAQKAFEQIGKVPAAERDAIADRYREARGKLVTRSGELREAEDWQRWTNVPKAEALIATAKEMLEAEGTPDLGNRLRQLQALWKEVGPMPQRRSKELWEQFKATCDQVYDKVKGVRAVEHEKFAEVAKVKEALIAEAEAIADSTDWAATADKLKALQAQWKQSGHLPRKQGDELWKRFRAACDRFFERRKPQLDAQHAEEVANLEKKQALVARAKAIADGAPGEGGWGKAIGAVKDLQREWKEVGFVPRRDADAIYKAFRTACDALFAKRDAARDAEADAHRAERDALLAEIAAVPTSDDPIARALAVRAKARELGGVQAELDAMVRALAEQHADKLAGTELDPAQLRARRDKLIAKAEELLPKQAPAVSAGGDPADIAQQLKAAMRGNAFGGLRFSGRDPIEVADELRASWRDIGPVLDDADRAQEERFEQTLGQALAAAGVAAREEPRDRGDRGDRGERGDRRRRRRERSAAPTVSSSEPIEPGEVALATPEVPPLTSIPDAAGSAVAAIESPPADIAVTAAAVPVSAHDAITQPARLPPEVPIGDVPASRTKTGTLPPPPTAEEVDEGWELGEEDPTAAASPPSSEEMAGDGAVEGDGNPGWD
jgi:uncharacterized protein DUF349